jgi:hypothetical protein
MLNPTLGQNLGRWAQVYFTSPPEKREEAVLELLRELNGESVSAEPETSEPQTSNSIVTETSMTPETVLCAECGHQNPGPQRFCGMCGSSLTFDGPLSREEAVLVSRKVVPEPDASLRFNATPPARPVENPVARDPVFPTLSLFAQVGEEASSPLSSSKRSSDIQWLRDKDREVDSSASPAVKYVLIGLVILLAGAYFYNRSWLQGHGLGQQGSSGVWTGSAGPPATPQSPVNSPPVASPTDAHSADNVSAATPDPANAKEPVAAEPGRRNGDAASSQAVSPPAVPASEITPEAARTAKDVGTAPTPPSPTATSPEPAIVAAGNAELAIADEYLTGKRGPRNSAVAARFLWRAVSKENTTAILLLSDLYLTGDGVPKSCDQARLLLYAAARKNVPEAGQKLRNLQSCR